MSSDNLKPTKLYQQDIVQRIAAPASYGIVLRCWHDAEDVPSTPISDPIMRPLQYGEVGVSFITDSGQREILPESELRLIDRTLQPGDYCKRTIDDFRSGVVVDVKVKGKLEHVISRERVAGWRTLDEVEERIDAEIGDYVVYEDWIGQVIEVFDESIIELSSGQLVRLPELGSRLSIGEKGSDILPPSTSGMQNLFGLLLGYNRIENSEQCTVIGVRHIAYAIAWLAVNQSLDPLEAEHRKRPQKFWYGQDISRLTLIQGRSDLEMRVGDRVYLKNSTGFPSTKHGDATDPFGVVFVNAFLVTETETMLDVLWQDGIQETLKSTDVIPYLNTDEYDCWPGDHVLWKNEGVSRPAIVQSVNASDRTARILFPETGTTELASVLELDPHGVSDSTITVPQSVSEGLGVRRGDFVFIHPIGSTNGYIRPHVPRIGELEPWVREGPFVEGQLAGWRKELAEMGPNIIDHRSSDPDNEPKIKRPSQGDGSFSWIGEVTGLNLDGTVQVIHPDWTVRVYPLERLTRLYDGIEQLEDDLWEDDISDDHDSVAEESEPVWTMDEEGVWRPSSRDSNDWEEVDDDYDLDSDEGSHNMDVDSRGWAEESVDEEEVQNNLPKVSVLLRNTESHLQSQNTTGTDTTTHADHSSVSNIERDGIDGGDFEEVSWKRFDILSSAPRDHAFYSSTPAQPSKLFLGRLSREYRVLASSLPETILVRAYEDRTDLLRSLIIGPHNTPYEDAPFVIDWMLDSNFPHSPPIAHFLSWTNGNGRVNPNLYEEGKVCLSILGTWAGDRNETWNAARSSLLQAFVSIQGLVLVKEPWFCEPAYDKLRGTEEGIVNSRLYNEKAYVLSRGFVRRALELPPGGLELEIAWLYHSIGRLDKVLKDSRRLIEKSKMKIAIAEEEQELAVPRLTTGGIIALERTLQKLQILRTPNHPNSQ